MKVKICKTRVSLSMSPKEYELLTEAIYYCESMTTDISAQQDHPSKTYADLVRFCGRFFDAAALPVEKFRRDRP